MNAIEIRDLSRSFRGLYAVDHLNMTVPVGVIYSLLKGTFVQSVHSGAVHCAWGYSPYFPGRIVA